ncbi:MAG: hypothetical protein E2602_14360 [Achromobacter sp.]|uniref:hypothetical protein n=1 Tax=Achromobacter pulmonis TaxID=1389932 RepID=UPI0012CADDE3|nr:hypothetical protein [Achromobacter pulmonis]MCF7770488.1 hypothetical protein [Achromobacter pulmonis]MPT28052.1 hypothetical protein [Achromobacter sp.]
MKRVPRLKIETELGTEIQCSRCKDFWPADREFFYTARGKLHPWCKACYLSDEKVIQKTERWKESQRVARAARNQIGPLGAVPARAGYGEERGTNG